MMIVNEKLRTFKMEVDDIENVDFEHGMIQEIAKAYSDAMDLKRYELVLNKNIITIKDKITGKNSYMGMKVSLEPLEKDISFIVRPSDQPTYEELQAKVNQLETNRDEAIQLLNNAIYQNRCTCSYCNDYYLKEMKDVLERGKE
jgi:hypothetical protein